MHVPIAAGNLELLRVLVRNVDEDKRHVLKGIKGTNTPLHLAAANGHVEVMKMIMIMIRGRGRRRRGWMMTMMTTMMMTRVMMIR
jgi:hypothetical protein